MKLHLYPYDGTVWNTQLPPVSAYENYILYCVRMIYHTHMIMMDLQYIYSKYVDHFFFRVENAFHGTEIVNYDCINL